MQNKLKFKVGDRIVLTESFQSIKIGKIRKGQKGRITKVETDHYTPYYSIYFKDIDKTWNIGMQTADNYIKRANKAMVYKCK